MGICASTQPKGAYGQRSGPYGPTNLNSVTYPNQGGGYGQSSYPSTTTNSYNQPPNYSEGINKGRNVSCPSCSQNLELPPNCNDAKCPRCQSVFRMQNGYPQLISSGMSAQPVYQQQPQYQPQPMYQQSSMGYGNQGYGGYNQGGYNRGSGMMGGGGGGMGMGSMALGIGGGLLGGMLLEDAIDGGDGIF